MCGYDNIKFDLETDRLEFVGCAVLEQEPEKQEPEKEDE